jgi:hypothetical protein
VSRVAEADCPTVDADATPTPPDIRGKSGLHRRDERVRCHGLSHLNIVKGAPSGEVFVSDQPVAARNGVANDQLLLTFRILRFALAIEGFREGSIRGSISAYFHSPVRSIFVGCLMAIGVCLIAIQARTVWEETFLNLAGLFAFVVALVPIRPESCNLVLPDAPVTFDPNVPWPTWLTETLDRASTGMCRVDESVDSSSDGLPEWAVTSIRNNVFSVIAVAALALLLIVCMRRWSPSKRSGPARAVRAGSIALAVYLGLLIIGVGLYATFDGNRSTSHYWAAGAMFAMFGVVVVISGWFRDLVPSGLRYQYRAIAALMVLVVPLGAVSLYALEAAEIALFAWFWTAQTIQVWDPNGDGARAVLPVAADVTS